MIEVTVTHNGVTGSFTITVDEWMDKRDAMFGIAPCDDRIHDILRDIGK